MMNQQGIPPPRWKQLHQKSNDILQQLRLSTPQLLKQSSRKSSLQLNTKQEQVSAAIEQQKMILAIAALQDEKNRLVREKEENEKLCRGSEEKRNEMKKRLKRAMTHTKAYHKKIQALTMEKQELMHIMEEMSTDKQVLRQLQQQVRTLSHLTADTTPIQHSPIISEEPPPAKPRRNEEGLQIAKKLLSQLRRQSESSETQQPTSNVYRATETLPTSRTSKLNSPTKKPLSSPSLRPERTRPVIKHAPIPDARSNPYSTRPQADADFGQHQSIISMTGEGPLSPEEARVLSKILRKCQIQLPDDFNRSSMTARSIPEQENAISDRDRLESSSLHPGDHLQEQLFEGDSSFSAELENLGLPDDQSTTTREWANNVSWIRKVGEALNSTTILNDQQLPNFALSQRLKESNADLNEPPNSQSSNKHSATTQTVSTLRPPNRDRQRSTILPQTPVLRHGDPPPNNHNQDHNHSMAEIYQASHIEVDASYRSTSPKKSNMYDQSDIASIAHSLSVMSY